HARRRVDGVVGARRASLPRAAPLLSGNPVSQPAGGVAAAFGNAAAGCRVSRSAQPGARPVSRRALSEGALEQSSRRQGPLSSGTSCILELSRHLYRVTCCLSERWAAN